MWRRGTSKLSRKVASAGQDTGSEEGSGLPRWPEGTAGIIEILSPCTGLGPGAPSSEGPLPEEAKPLGAVCPALGSPSDPVCWVQEVTSGTHIAGVSPGFGLALALRVTRMEVWG